MGLYNVIFGQNPISDTLLKIVGLTKADCGRFRDVFVDQDTIAVYTRNGGGNRDHYDEEKASGESCDCYGCAITYRLPKHPLYLRDEDDSFDCTYATIWFKLPEDLDETLRELIHAMSSNEPIDMSQRWLDAIATLTADTPKHQER